MKIMKLSLVGAVLISAVSSVNAQNLEETLKDIDISGTAIYRYNDYQNSSTTNYYKIATSIKSKLADDMSFNSRVIAGDGTAPKSFNSSNNADDNISITVSEANFIYSGLDNTLISIGKNAIATPFTIQRSATGDEQVGTGITATTKLENITFSTGYYNQTNFDKSGNVKSLYVNKSGSDFAYVQTNTTIENINIDAAYANAQDILDMYTIGLSSNNKFSDFELSTFARYTSLNKDIDNNKNSLWKVGAELNTGIYGAFIAYGETNKEGGTVGIDEGSTVGFDEHWRVTLTGISDASTLYASINAQVLPKLNLALKYSDLQAGNNSNGVDQNEIYAQATYKMYSKLKTYLMIGEYDKEGNDKSTIGRVTIQYSF